MEYGISTTTMMKAEGQNDYTPDWAGHNDPTKPEWVDRIPDTLWELGAVFFPIPRKEKGWNYPHHLDSHRYAADSEILNAYLEAGSGYGIACAGELAVVDIDEKDKVDEITDKLPKTAYQWSGSREGVHLFYFVPGLDTRQMMYEKVLHDCDSDEHSCREDKNGICIRLSDYDHLGEVKCDPHGYVIGPGSVHPSGNRYGPLRGDEIATVDKDEFMEVIEQYKKPEDDTAKYRDSADYDPEDYEGDAHAFYELSADDVLPWLEPEKRIAHPVHGSTTGSNFMKNSDGETFMCWRCQYGSGGGCGLNGTQFLAAEKTGLDCEDVRRHWEYDSTLHYRAWLKAVEEGLVGYSDIPYRVAHGYAVDNGVLDNDEKLSGDLYFDVMNGLKYEMQMEELR